MGLLEEKLNNLKSLLGSLESLSLEDYDILYGEIEALQYFVFEQESEFE